MDERSRGRVERSWEPEQEVQAGGTWSCRHEHPLRSFLSSSVVMSRTTLKNFIKQEAEGGKMVLELNIIF